MKKEEIFKAYKDFIVPSYAKVTVDICKRKRQLFMGYRREEISRFLPWMGRMQPCHCHSKVMSAIRDQVSKLIFVPNNYHHVLQAKLARELNFWAQTPYKAFFANSGAEANEAAIKLARKFGQGRYEIITFNNSFHGRTLAALSATGQKNTTKGSAPLVQGFVSVDFNDLGAVKTVVNDKTVAIMLELVQGEGGINAARAEFVQGLKELCSKNKLLLIIDEVQTGIGRTGTMFAWQQYGIEPDIFTLAKSLGGGLPIGVMLAKTNISDVLTPGSHASTFGGGPVVCRAALAVLRAIQKEKLLKQSQASGAYLRDALTNLKSRHAVIKEVRAIGLMCGVELNVPGNTAVEACMQKGLLINCTHQNVLRIMPALNVTRGQLNEAVRILDAVLGSL